jgi:uncharacterized protein
MAHTPHDLVVEFPEYAEKIRRLKLEDTYFARLNEQYFKINEAVYHAETNVVPTDDFNETAMRKKRLRLKDEIFAILSKD